MRIVLFAMSAAVPLGYLAGGRLGNLAKLRFRWPLAGAAGIGLQFVPAAGTVGTLLLVASFLFLLAAAGRNRRLPGFVLILAGLWLNFLVITVNEGMPVTRNALVASAQADTLASMNSGTDPKHHLATGRDQLVFLADTIPIPPPVHQALSVGDLLAYSGAAWFVTGGMRRNAAVPDPPAGGLEPQPTDGRDPHQTELATAEAP